MQQNKDIQQAIYYSNLIVKFINKNINESEQNELFKWVHSSPENKQLFDRLIAEEVQLNSNILPSVNKTEAWANILQKNNPSIQHPLKSWVKYAAAAAVVISLSVAAYFVQQPKSGPSVAATEINDIEDLPKDNAPVLTLSDGRQISLSQLADEDVLSGEIEDEVIKADEEQLIYEKADVSSEMVYNSLSIPRGSTFTLVLEDGTKVWLNADSYLRYPIAFGKQERRVELVGEAYFEVAKNPNKPFIVESKNTAIQVLGTAFNVYAYKDVAFVRTTLKEGSVRIHHKDKSTVLKPGQEALAYDFKSNIKVYANDIEQALDWKNGYFIFRDEELESIMQRISRWYNIQVEYQDETLKDFTFGGKFSKKSTLAELLKSLELTGTVKFKTIERRVIVMR